MPLERFKGYNEASRNDYRYKPLYEKVDKYQDLTLEVLKSCLEFISPDASRATFALRMLAEHAGIELKRREFFSHTDAKGEEVYREQTVIKDRTL